MRITAVFPCLLIPLIAGCSSAPTNSALENSDPKSTEGKFDRSEAEVELGYQSLIYECDSKVLVGLEYSEGELQTSTYPFTMKFFVGFTERATKDSDGNWRPGYCAQGRNPRTGKIPPSGLPYGVCNTLEETAITKLEDYTVISIGETNRSFVLGKNMVFQWVSLDGIESGGPTFQALKEIGFKEESLYIGGACHNPGPD